MENWASQGPHPGFFPAITRRGRVQTAVNGARDRPIRDPPGKFTCVVSSPRVARRGPNADAAVQNSEPNSKRLGSAACSAKSLRFFGPNHLIFSFFAAGRLSLAAAKLRLVSGVGVGKSKSFRGASGGAGGRMSWIEFILDKSEMPTPALRAWGALREADWEWSGLRTFRGGAYNLSQVEFGGLSAMISTGNTSLRKIPPRPPDRALES